jgi:hypothetical protein
MLTEIFGYGPRVVFSLAADLSYCIFFRYPILLLLETYYSSLSTILMTIVPVQILKLYLVLLEDSDPTRVL